jgi:hypothetical protein
MGAWGVGSFENDDAMDWIAILLDSDGTDAIHEALEPLLADGGGYLEAPECSAGLAAAEVLAALAGRPAAELPDEVKTWVASHRALGSAGLIARAHKAVQAVATSSELKDLASDSDQMAAWQAAIADLTERL